MSRIPIAFVGGGLRSAVGRAHFSALGLDGVWEVVGGVFSRDAEVNQETARRYGVKEVYGSLNELIERNRGRPWVVAVLTPTPEHFGMVKRLLEAGFGVVCEKTLTTTVEEAVELQKLVKTKGGFLTVVYNYSGYPMMRELRRRVRDGELGRLLHFQAEMPQEGYLRVDWDGRPVTVQDWREKDGEIPTIYLDLGVHLHELVDYVTGEKPIAVWGMQSVKGLHGVVDQVMCMARYTGGLEGAFWFSKSALGYRNGLRLRIFGEKGAAEWHQMEPELLRMAFADGRKEIVERGAGYQEADSPRYTRFKAGHPAGFVEALGNLYRDIAEAYWEHKNKGAWHSEEVYGVDFAVEGMIFLEAVAKASLNEEGVRLNSGRNF